MDFNSLRKEINSKNASVKELVNDVFSKIDSKDPEINSYICTTKNKAIDQAENIDCDGNVLFPSNIDNTIFMGNTELKWISKPTDLYLSPLISILLIS